MPAVEQGRDGDGLSHSDDPRAADPGDAHAEFVVADDQVRLGQLVGVEPVQRVAGCARRAGDDGEEGRTVARQARVVLVARGLVDLGLAAELGLHWVDREAVGGHAAVAASLADPLVDDDAPIGRGHRAALALASLLGGALLVVDEHGDPGDCPQDILGFEHPGAVPHLHAVGQPSAGIPLGVLGRDDDLLDALGEQFGDDPGHRGDADRRLGAGHRDVTVVEQLVRDVHSAGDGRADAEDAGVGEGAVAEVLDEEVLAGKR